MADLPTWEIWAILVASTVIGSVLVFLLYVVLALVLRWAPGIREPPAVALFVAEEVVDYFRRRLFRRMSNPALEPVHSEPAAAASTRSSLPM